MVVGGVVRDFRIDIGRVLSVSPTSIVLQERDGTSQEIPISTSTEVWLGNQQLTAAALAHGCAHRPRGGSARADRACSRRTSSGRRE